MEKVKIVCSFVVVALAFILNCNKDTFACEEPQAVTLAGAVSNLGLEYHCETDQLHVIGEEAFIQRVANASGTEIVTQPAEQEVTTMYTTARVNVRQAPGVDGAILMVLDEDSEVSVLGEENAWSNVEVDGITAWIYSEYLR